MLYKPNFCCNCGEKIQRIEWNLLTSRRFCEVCSAENKKYDLLPRIAVGGGLLAAVFGFGSFYGNSGPSRDEPRQLNLSHAGTRSAVPQRAIQSEEQTQPVQPSAPVLQAPVDAGIDRIPPDQNQFALKNGSKAGAVYFCGARTKKGTPCSRPVKDPATRCYQHEGKPAAMPEN